MGFSPSYLSRLDILFGVDGSRIVLFDPLKTWSFHFQGLLLVLQLSHIQTENHIIKGANLHTKCPTGINTPELLNIKYLYS